jgi:hypothetical protein
MGWAPIGNTLVVGTSDQVTVGWGPWEIAAVAVEANGQNKVTMLTHTAMSFPFTFTGFVHTA